MARALAWAYQTPMHSSMTLCMNSVPSVWGQEHSMWACCMEGVRKAAAHCSMLQYSRLPQLVAHQYNPIPHLLIEPLREPPASRPPLMGLDRAGPKVGRRLGLRSTEDARGV